MHRIIVLTVICFSILLSGCATPKKDMSAFYAHKPRSILVVPVLNESPEVSASPVFISTITKPLAERGYYVFPVYLTSLILRDFGLSEAGHIHQLSPHRLYELFGADSVLFVVIKDWSSKYILLQSTVAVEMDYELRDTKTGIVLWQANQRVVQGSGGGGGLVGMAVMAAVNALFTDYRPLAREANRLVFIPPKGLPAGPYHIDYGKDQDKFK
jgi:hypothetical protein